MASFEKVRTGWRVSVNTKGVRDSSTFSTKIEAQTWASKREVEIRKFASKGGATDKYLDDALTKYSKEVSVEKKGKDWEEVRLLAISAHLVDKKPFGTMLLHEIDSAVLARWRDMRLQTVSGSTVNRELNLLSHVFTIARKEWKWILESPTTDVTRPKNAAARDRRITEEEIEKLKIAFGFNGEVRTKNHAVMAAFLFAIETAMRAGEICWLPWSSIKGSVATLPAEVNKNGSKRDVPLSPRALEILKMLPKNGETCFGITSASLDALYRKARATTGIDDLKFHDTRHEAITRLAKKLNVLELARMVGHKDLKMLQVYYNESAENLAKLL